MFKISKKNNLLLKQLILVVLVLIFSSIGLAVVFSNSSYVTERGYYKSQPIAFPHTTHARDLGLDCKYCHAQTDRSNFADIPSMETCYGCHRDILQKTDYLRPVRQAYLDEKPLAWERVNNLADHVHFNHAAHINNGVSCVSCHGDVENMPLIAPAHHFNMKFCLDCHRQQENKNLQGCTTCHR